MARELCAGARRSWPGFVAEMGVKLDKTDQVVVTALMLFMLESWADDWIDSRSLPAPDWEAAGLDADEIAVCAELAAEWRGALNDAAAVGG